MSSYLLPFCRVQLNAARWSAVALVALGTVACGSDAEPSFYAGSRRTQLTDVWGDDGGGRGGDDGAGGPLAGAHPADARTQALADRLLPEVGEVIGLPPRQPVVAVTLDQAGVRRVLADERRQTGNGQVSPAEAAEDEAYLDKMEGNVLGLYDPRSKRLMLVEGLSEEETVGTMRHELTHALQDQHFSLLKLQAKAQATLDGTLALTSVLEGQAMVAMDAQGQKPTLPLPADPTPPWAGDLQDGGHPGIYAALRAASAVTRGRLSPTVGALLADEKAGGKVGQGRHDASSQQQGPYVANFRRTVGPLASLRPNFDLLGERDQGTLLVFPYVAGSEFIRSFASEHTLADVVRLTLANVPVSTQQILHPSAYVADLQPTSLPLPALIHLPAHKTAWDSRLGEFANFLLLGGGQQAAAVAAGWRGDRVLVLMGPRGDAINVLVSHWRNGVVATRYGRALVNRFMHQGARRTADGGLVQGDSTLHVYRSGDYVALIADCPPRDLPRLRQALEADLQGLGRILH